MALCASRFDLADGVFELVEDQQIRRFMVEPEPRDQFQRGEILTPRSENVFHMAMGEPEGGLVLRAGGPQTLFAGDPAHEIREFRPVERRGQRGERPDPVGEALRIHHRPAPSHRLVAHLDGQRLQREGSGV